MTLVYGAPAPAFVERYVNRTEARKRFGQLADEYARFMTRTDPLADEVAAWMRGSERREAFERAVRSGIRASDGAPLRKLFASIDERPTWVNADALALGAQTYQRIGKSMMFILSAWSLMNGYHSAPAVKPLAFTGQLERMAPRRLAETGRFIVATMQRGALERFGEGFQIALRVRLMHAFVRQRVWRAGWNPAWGAPINQADMAGTVVEFSLLVIAGAEMLGYHFTDDEREALLHLWRYSGFVSGVDERLLEELSSVPRGARFAELIDLVQPGPDDDSLALAAALRRVPAQVAERPFEKALAPLMLRVHDGLTYAFNGDEIASALQIPNRRWRHVVVPLRAVVRTLERIRRSVPGSTRVVASVNNRAVSSHIQGLLKGLEPTYR